MSSPALSLDSTEDSVAQPAGGSASRALAGMRPGAITLTRHGEPALSRKCLITARQYGDWWAKYEIGGLLAGQTPPPELVATDPQGNHDILASAFQSVFKDGDLYRMYYRGLHYRHSGEPAQASATRPSFTSSVTSRSPSTRLKGPTASLVTSAPFS